MAFQWDTHWLQGDQILSLLPPCWQLLWLLWASITNVHFGLVLLFLKSLWFVHMHLYRPRLSPAAQPNLFILFQIGLSWPLTFNMLIEACRVWDWGVGSQSELGVYLLGTYFLQTAYRCTHSCWLLLTPWIIVGAWRVGGIKSWKNLLGHMTVNGLMFIQWSPPQPPWESATGKPEIRGVFHMWKLFWLMSGNTKVLPD